MGSDPLKGRWSLGDRLSLADALLNVHPSEKDVRERVLSDGYHFSRMFLFSHVKGETEFRVIFFIETCSGFRCSTVVPFSDVHLELQTFHTSTKW